MNNNYLEKLEFNKIKEILSTFSCTYIGKEYCANLFPTNIKEDVKYSLKETQEAVNLISRNSCPSFYEIADISINLKNLESNNTLSIKSLLELTTILKLANELKEYFNKDFIENNDYPILCNLFIDLYSNKNIIEKINLCIIDENTIDDKASKSLSSIRKKQKNLEQDIRNKLSQMIHSSTYSKFIQDSLVTIRIDRFVIPVKEEYRSQIKGFVHDISNAGSTVFIEPISIFEMNNELNQLKIDENIEIEKILKDLSSLFYPYIEQLKMDSDLIGKLDFIFAKAKFSNSLNAITPIINDKKEINLINARHPLIDKNKVVPINIHLGRDFRCLVITGPNTGGKTVTLKTVGLLELMACSGLNIPADEKSSIYVFDEIFADIGDEQSISESLSTFSSHMSNIVNITHSATSDSLILVDELGSGTDPLEGAHLAISILQYFTNLGAITVATSHYQELKKYALVTPGFKNASVEFDIENLRPTYRLLIGIPGKSNAFAISRKLGLSEEIIQRATSMIDKETINLEDLLKKIYDDKAKIETEKAQTVKALEEAQKLRDSLKNQHSNVSEREKELISNAKQEAKQILLDAKETANSLIRDISSTNSASQANKLRNKLNDKIASVSATSENAVIDSISPAILRENIKPGLNVYVSNLKTNGTVVSNISKDDTVQVQIGMMKMKVDIKNLHETSSASTSGKNKSGKNSGAQISNGSNYSQKSSFKAQSVSPEINLLGMTVDEAIPIVDKYLDDCYIAKLSPVRIVHGKGTGALRNGIQKYLKTNKIVDNFRPGTFR